MKKINHSAFTLVELVITIAITTIIASISYIAFQDYFTTSKDSMRIEDMKSLNASMNSIKLQNGGYSYPGNYFAIINSGTSSEQVYQGFIDSNVALNNMLQIPKDPKTSNHYVLSTTKTKQQYQIAMTLDNNGDNKAYVDGDYYSNSITLFPSIILAYSGTNTQEIGSGIVTNGSTGSINRSKFILNGSRLNMPYSFSTKNVVWTATSYNQIIEESGVKIDRNIDYYTCKDLYDDKKFLGAGNYDLLDSTNGTYVTTSCDGVTSTINCGINQAWNGSSCVSQYDGCDTPDIAVGTRQLWAACNVGASKAYTGTTIATCGGSSDCNSTIRNIIGSYFQRGRNTDITSATAQLTGPVASETNTNFYANLNAARYNWLSTPNPNLWGGSTSDTAIFEGQTDDILRQGPCKTGYHVPSAKDWCDAIKIIEPSLNCNNTSQSNTSIASTLKLPLAGARECSSAANYVYQGQRGGYWSSSPSSVGTDSSPTPYFSSSVIYPLLDNNRGYGYSVRCLKNDVPSYFPGEDGISGNSDDCNTPNIVLGNGQEWSACNLGATNAYTGITITDCGGSSSDCNSSIRNTLGNYYQWGRNDDITSSTVTGTLALAGTLANTVGHNLFIGNPSANYDWIVTQNTNLWGGIGTTTTVGTYSTQNSTNQALMQGPCPTGRHVPTIKEWCNTVNTISGISCVLQTRTNNTSVATTLKIPMAGFRNYDNGKYYGGNSFYWSTSPNGFGAYYGGFTPTQIQVVNNAYPYNTYGYSVRCLKN